jgi:UDP-N-acetylglucosamine transferase subunit ALG13
VIFVTVGTDGPFDRLVRAVDSWAGETGQRDVFAQIGQSEFRPLHMKSVPSLGCLEFAHCVRSAAIVVAHAGMGTILTALEYGKPVIVMPRVAALAERRNDHQLATARSLAPLGRVAVAFNEDELRLQLERIDELTAGDSIGQHAQPQLVAAIRDFIHRRPSARECA